MADLASFQNQANSIYDPQAAAQKASLTSGYTAEKNQLGLYKTETAQSYEKALRGVDESEKTQVASLNQLYSSRLMGNFSGMQSNALQGLYGKDNQARADLSLSRANKLAEISGKEVAALDKYNTDNSNVDTRISGEKAKYANEGYNSALKQEEQQRRDTERQQQEAQRQANSDRQFALSESRAAAAEARSSRSQSSSDQKQYKANKFASGNYDFKGPNNESISLSDFISGSGGDSNSLKSILQNGTNYDYLAYKQIAGLKDDNEILARLKKYDSKNYYGYN